MATNTGFNTYCNGEIIELREQLAKANSKIDALEEELAIAFECIENSGVDYDEATEQLRKEQS